jgi:membrane protease subunit HflK
MYLETMERLFGGTDKIIIDSNSSSGVVPYLPLSELSRPRTTTPNPPPQQQTGGTR